MNGIELTPEHPVDRLADLGERAEAAGFDAVFAASHYFNRDPFAALGRIAAATDDVAVGPAAANPYDTHPVALASRVATLQEASDGRAIFGLGPGDRSALRALGIDRERPLRRVLETLQVSRRLFAGERVTHDGTFQVRDAGLEYEIEAVPLYVAAQGPDMLRMAGKYGDGVLINAAHPRDVSWAADRIAEGRGEREDGVDPAALAYAPVSVATDAADARSLARRPVAFVAAGADEAVLDRHDLDRARARSIGAAIERGEFHAAFDGVSPAMVDALAVAGDPAEVADRLAALAEYVDGVVVGSPLGPDLDAAIDLAADALEEVLE